MTQRGPPPRPGSGPGFDPQAGRPFKDHFTSGAQQFGIRPMAPSGGGPAGRFSLRGPLSGGPSNMVPPHTRQFQGRPPEGSSFQGNYPVGQPSGFTLRHCLPPRQGFSGPLSGGPCFQGPWQVSAPSGYPVGQPSGFTLRHCLPPRQGFSGPLSGGPCFQGRWQVSAPSEFSSQHPMPQGFPKPSFQGQNYIGMHPPRPGPHNL